MCPFVLLILYAYMDMKAAAIRLGYIFVTPLEAFIWSWEENRWSLKLSLVGSIVENTVDSRYLEVEGNLKNSSRYP